MVGAGNEPLEVLSLREELTSVPAFEFALRERVSRLSGFRHACYGYVCGVERAGKGTSKLAIVSEHVPGVRLAEILAVAERELLPLEIDAGLCLIRQLVQAVAMLHEHTPDVCHGAIAPERIVITPTARLVVVEHVLGAALGQLAFSRERYWKELRIPLPPRAGAARFDRRTDVTQVGAIALALVMGRPLRDDEFPARISEIAERIGAVAAGGGLEPLPTGIRTWLARALQLDPLSSFASAIEALAELDGALAASGYAAAPAALESFLGHYYACVQKRGTPAGHVPLQAPKAHPTPAPALVSVPAPSSAAESATRTSPATSSLRNHPPIEPTPEPVSYVEEAEDDMPMPNKTASSRGRLVAAGVVLVALTSGGMLAARQYLMPSAAADTSGTLVVNTNPAGVDVIIDGRTRGVTPLTVSLTPGAHVLELGPEGARRNIPLTITAGGHTSQFIELPASKPAVGKLQVRTEPSGARVSVDGQSYGRSPLTIDDLAPGSHAVVLENELGSVKQEVTIDAGATASLVVPMTGAANAPVSGWITVSAPVDVQLFENGRLLGSSRSERIMVPVGRHEIEVVNEAIGFRATHTVQVGPGQVAPVRLDWPKGAMALNALPWADVFIDGKLVGETPIGNVVVPVGPHEVVFRHPDLGEQRFNAMVTLGAPVRLSVDLRKK